MSLPVLNGFTRGERMRGAAHDLGRFAVRARNRLRANDVWLLTLAIGVGLLSGLTAHVLNQMSQFLHSVLFGLPAHNTLSGEQHVDIWRLLLWLPAGGALLGGVTWWWRRRHPNSIVDAVEANALHGGRMSMRDSLFLGLQTLISNGFGASVGLEAAYAQIGSGAASGLGARLHLRRNDLRVLVGAGAGSAIAAAFGAPLTGAFYAFELIIGSYTVASIAPVVGAALAGYAVSWFLGGVPHIVEPTASNLGPTDYLFAAGLGLVAALVSVAIMRLVSALETFVKNRKAPRALQPVLGGVLAALLALASPAVLSSGHGALEHALSAPFAPDQAALLFFLKAAAAVVCLGLGFRGGLFFASLLLGALLGELYWWAAVSLGVGSVPDIQLIALVGMGALAAGVVGGPFTMTFLVLETTGDFGLSGCTLASALVCTLVVREIFGYSFSTWRLHMRGETVRSAHDVGRIRSLTVGKLMRKDPQTAESSITTAEFKRRYPLGSTPRVVLVDSARRYGGVVLAPDVYAAELAPQAPVAELARLRQATLTEDLSVAEAIKRFDAAGADELAVVDASGQVVGLLTESYAARRLAEELEKTRRDLTGEAFA
jgi:CIC family chloride channel protein